MYRLNVVPIHIPPLRERGYDIIMLSRYFLSYFSNIYNKKLTSFTPECEKLLLDYMYPGNIRELRNLIEYGVIFEEGNAIGIDNIDKQTNTSNFSKNKSLAELTRQYEKSVVQSYLNRYGENLEGKAKTAKLLGISMATLYRKLE